MVVAYHARCPRSILDQGRVHRCDAPGPQAFGKTEDRPSARSRLLDRFGDHPLLLVALIAVEYRGGLLLDIAESGARIAVHRECAGEGRPQFAGKEIM